MMPRSVRRATLIAVPTGFVRDTLVDAYGVDAGRIAVVPHGIPDVPRPDPDRIAMARRSIGLDDRPYVVYPAITHPHKRHALLVEMLAHLHGDERDLALVLLGGPGAADPDVAAAIARSPRAELVVRPGRVTEGVRDALVAGAEVLAFPSEYEGFGAPLVEAMSLGTPVVCSGQAAIREVVGEAALVVPSADPAAWADAVRAARADRDRLVAAGRSRRLDFTLAVSGRALATAYRRAVRGASPT